MTNDAPPAVGVASPLPPGPGVQPPFVAPPTDGVRRRRWIGLAVAGGLSIVGCIGGLLGYGALSVFGQQMIVDRSTAAVADYLGAIRDGEYHKAFGVLCPSVRQAVDESQFTDQLVRSPAISSFTVGTPAVDADPIEVPVTVRYTDGSTDTITYPVVANQSTGEFEVCGTGG